MTQQMMSELQGLLAKLAPKDRDAVVAEAMQATSHMAWVPNPGPQTKAYYCEADELLFGGEAGGGKSDFLLGLALNEHRQSRILRRINQDAAELGDRLVEILGTADGYTSHPPTWHGDGKLIEFRGCELEKDKQRFKGRARDFIGYDELADFLESQYLFINIWNRTTVPGQRCRIVGATNGPTTAEGQWIIRRWAAWLDDKHPNPAEDGELRWYLTVGEKEVEVDGPGPHDVPGRGLIRATSRTFIRSRLEDNPDLMRTDYGTKLEGLPDELYRVYRKGDFTVGMRDQEWQVIPTAWIIAAQERWKEDGWRGLMMTAAAIDPAGGGRDSAVLSTRYGAWFAPLDTAQGPETADGSAMAAMVIRRRRDGCPVVVDVGGGYGGSVMLRFKDNGIEAAAFNGANKSMGKTRDGKLAFVNRRAEAWWRMREELDPDQEGGSVIALPPDAELRADLAAPTWELRANGIVLESKDDIRERLGRSPGKGDAVVMCLAEGNKATQRRTFSGGRRPKVITERKPWRRT